MVETPDGRPFFFVHVMKTAGMTFNTHIRANFAPEETYPGPDDTTGVDYWVINNLRAAVAERRDRVRIWRGHFPYFVTGLVPEAITLSLLREPVARTVSLIDQHRRLNAPDATLEEIYEDPKVFERTVHNHQTKIFAMRDDDGINAWTQSIPLDEERLALAKRRVLDVDLLGFQEDFDRFLDELVRRWRWRIEPVERVNAAEQRATISESFRRRIEQDNAMDMELYDYARTHR